MNRTLLIAILLPLGQLALASPQAAGAHQSSVAPGQARNSDMQPGPSTTDEPRVLQPGSSKPVPVPPFSVFRESKCDSNGNLYFAVGGNLSRLGSILEISHDASASTAFAPPTPEKFDPIHEIGFRDFAVTPSGSVYELLQNPNDLGIIVIEFDSDGSVRRTTKPATPEGLQVRSLAVFNDGTVMLRGFIRQMPGKDAAQDYVALFDSSGKLRKEVAGLPDVDLALRKTALQDNGIAIGQDDNAYLLDANFISVISGAGENVRRVPYRKPDSALVARGLRLSDGLIAIRVMRATGVERTPGYLVVRADSGETIGYYTLPDETPEMGMCFSRSDGFTFLTQQDMKLALVNARLR